MLKTNKNKHVCAQEKTRCENGFKSRASSSNRKENEMRKHGDVLKPPRMAGRVSVAHCSQPGVSESKRERLFTADVNP